MQYPWGRCRECGERVFATVDGEYRCPNCGAVYSAADTDRE